MSSPFFSIIIPAFNAKATIGRTITSVITQSFDEFEVIVVDDGSTDNTFEVVEAFEDPRIHCLRYDNGGPSRARNQGARVAKGRYLVFLDADDWLNVGYLSEFHSLLANNGNAKLGLGFIRWEDPQGKAVRVFRPWKKEREFAHGMPGSFVISSDLFRELGGYDENLSYSENSDLFLRMITEKKATGMDVVISEVAGVNKETFDRDKRRHRYLVKKYDSLMYFMQKHKSFFERSTKDYLNFKRTLAICAIQSHRFSEARHFIGDTIRRSPFSIKSYVQFVLCLFPRLAELYYGRN